MLQNQTNNYVERPPRIQPPLPINEVEIPAPPDKNTANQQSIIDLLLPLVTIGAYLLLAVAGRGRSIWLMIPMSLAMLGSIFVSMRRANEAKKLAERKRLAYDRRLAQLRQELRNDHQLQRDFYHYNYPNPQTVLSIAKEDEVSRSGSRIWERRLHDQDFGVIRLGIGTRESTVVYKLNQNQNDEDPQMNDAQRLAEDSRFIDEVPVTLQLRPTMIETPLHDIQHTLGIYALGKQNVPDHNERFKPLYDYVRSLLLHFAVFHSPRDAHLYVIGTEAASQSWDWIQNLQHVHMGQNREEDLLCFEGEQVTMEDSAPVVRLPLFLRELRNILIVREQRLQDQDVSAGAVTVPHMLLVVDLLGIAPDSILADIESNETIAMIVAKGQALGVSIIFLAETPNQVPSDTQAIIELETLERNKTVFRYAEIGMNTPRYVGAADQVSASFAARFVEAIRDFDIRASAAASLVAAVDLLEMNRVVDIDELTILENWKRSRAASNSEWPRVPIGIKNANEPPREITFSANADGVHGMIAGTTGSGKSEMLLTLIVGLAINYDPSVVNFVLVDFKGGATFEEFKTLPHCVDIVTNLGANAVDRMFSAIKAELDRRGEMVAQYKVEHIVDFRKKNYHLAPPAGTDKLPAQPFPHLFIIVDEFAEMVSENPEYKSQLDSITRLGRAIGVSLILATQKPGGAITDQMRANMKMKICLRVETPEDSRELLRRSDAAFLPTSIPGRAYLQIGNEPLELVQVARAGGPYRRLQKVEQQEVVWLTREKKKEAQQVQRTEEKVKPISTAIVDVMEAKTKHPDSGILPQRKPWPNPLPKYLPLGINLWDLNQVDPTYLKDDQMYLHGGQIPPRDERTPTYLVREMRGWLDALEYTEQHADEPRITFDKLGWQDVNWEKDQLSVPIGLIDHPRQARLRLLNLSLLEGNIVVVGTTGWGKTTYLRTMITSLAAKYPPSAVHMYILDFGGRNLMVFKNLPHVGAVITPEDTERIDRLIRFLNNTLDERKELINNANTDDLVSYNIASSEPDNDLEPIPAILVMIDNFAEIKDNFEGLIPTLISLFREGRNVGIFFAATADSAGAMGGKSFALFSQRFALRQNEKGDFLPIVGRGAVPPIEAYGRGLMSVERAISNIPLEFQIAAPIPAYGLEYKQNTSIRALDDEDARPISREIDEDRTIDKLAAVLSRRLETLVSLMNHQWEVLTNRATRSLPEEMRRLANHIDITEMFEVSDNYPTDDVAVPLGTRDLDLEPLWVSLEKNPNSIILGPPLSGRTTLLRTWVLMLAYRYDPSQAAIVLVDMQKRLHDYRGGSHSVADLPHVREVITEENQLEAFIEKLRFEYEFQRPSNDADLPAEAMAKLPDVARPQVFIFIDNYDDLSDVLNEDRNIKRSYEGLGKLARSYGTFGLHLILAGGDETSKGNDAVTKQVWQSRLGFSMKVSKYADGKLQAKVDKPLRDQEFNNGRGLYVQSGRSELVQIATPEPANKSLSYANTLNGYVQEIIDRYADKVAAFNDRYGTNTPRLPWYYDMVPPEIREPKAEEAPAQPNGKPAPASAKQQAPSTPDLDMRENGSSTAKPTPTPSSIARKRKEYAIQIDKMRGRLGADKLSKMPLSLLSDLPLRYEDMNQKATAEFLQGQSEYQINTMLDSGKLQLPTDLEEGLSDRVTAWWRAYRTISGKVITRYPLSFLQNELGVGFGEHNPQDVQEMEPDAVQALIDRQEIILPKTINHATLMSLQQPPSTLLTGEVLVHLAGTQPDQLDEMKVTLHNLTAADLAGMAPAQGQALVDEGKIDLPLVLPLDQFNILRSLKKALRQKSM